jgi:hypothetical protein
MDHSPAARFVARKVHAQKGAESTPFFCAFGILLIYFCLSFCKKQMCLIWDNQNWFSKPEKRGGK